jgi:hypothetical protein
MGCQQQTSKDRIIFMNSIKLFQHKQQVVHQLAFKGDPKLHDCGLIFVTTSGMGLPDAYVSNTLSGDAEVMSAVKALTKLMVEKLRPGTSIEDVRQLPSKELTIEAIPTPADLLGDATGLKAAQRAASFIAPYLAKPGAAPSKWWGFLSWFSLRYRAERGFDIRLSHCAWLLLASTQALYGRQYVTVRNAHSLFHLSSFGCCLGNMYDL